MCSSILTPGGGGTGTAKIKMVQHGQGQKRGQTRDNMGRVNDEHGKAMQVSGHAHAHTYRHNVHMHGDIRQTIAVLQSSSLP